MPIQTSGVRPQPVLIMSLGSAHLISAVVAPLPGEFADLPAAGTKERNRVGVRASLLELQQERRNKVSLNAARRHHVASAGFCCHRYVLGLAELLGLQHPAGTEFMDPRHIEVPLNVGSAGAVERGLSSRCHRSP